MDQAATEEAARDEQFLQLLAQANSERRAVETRIAADLPDDVDDPTSVVYYIRFADRIKIGFSRDLGKRLTAIPHDELLTVEPGARGVEARRHLQFADHRILGELFAPAPELLAHIEELKIRHAQRQEWRDAVRELDRAALDAIDPLRSRRSDKEVLRSLRP